MSLAAPPKTDAVARATSERLRALLSFVHELTGLLRCHRDARGELLYDEAFSIAKVRSSTSRTSVMTITCCRSADAGVQSILERISMFTVEDTQRFGNNFTPVGRSRALDIAVADTTAPRRPTSSASFES